MHIRFTRNSANTPRFVNSTSLIAHAELEKLKNTLDFYVVSTDDVELYNPNGKRVIFEDTLPYFYDIVPMPEVKYVIFDETDRRFFGDYNDTSAKIFDMFPNVEQLYFGQSTIDTRFVGNQQWYTMEMLFNDHCLSHMIIDVRSCNLAEMISNENILQKWADEEDFMIGNGIIDYGDDYTIEIYENDDPVNFSETYFDQLTKSAV